MQENRTQLPQQALRSHPRLRRNLNLNARTVGRTSPLETPPGVALADKLMDAQDEIDRAELISVNSSSRSWEKRR